MCVIAIAKNRKVTEDEFKNCFSSNGDGFGISWRKNNKVMYEKGFMDQEKAWQFYNEKKISGCHILHFRIGTSGGNVRELTHPFVISKTSPLSVSYAGRSPVLFHNGILSNWEPKHIRHIIQVGKVAEGSVSDTRALAMMLSVNNANLLLDDDDYNRFVIFTKNKSYVWGKWLHEKGVYFSNTSFQPTRSYKYY